MLVIECPFCGHRDEKEFDYCGPWRPQRRQVVSQASDEEFLEYLTVPHNAVGEIQEYWWHRRGCGSFLVATRDTRNHRIIAVRNASEQ